MKFSNHDGCFFEMYWLRGQSGFFTCFQSLTQVAEDYSKKMPFARVQLTWILEMEIYIRNLASERQCYTVLHQIKLCMRCCTTEMQSGKNRIAVRGSCCLQLPPRSREKKRPWDESPNPLHPATMGYEGQSVAGVLWLDSTSMLIHSHLMWAGGLSCAGQEL